MLILNLGYFYIQYKEKALSRSIWIIYALQLCPANLDKTRSTPERFYLWWVGWEEASLSKWVINSWQINRKSQLLLGKKRSYCIISVSHCPLGWECVSQRRRRYRGDLVGWGKPLVGNTSGSGSGYWLFSTKISKEQLGHQQSLILWDNAGEK